MMKNALLGAALTVLGTVSQAGTPVVQGVNASNSGGNWRFSVTLHHADEGWNHYADGWGVYLEDGTKLGYRVLAHPHVNEQPFTRSLGGITIPTGTTTIKIIPHDLVHGDGDAYLVKLNNR